jgi:cob(I)alamin adenosyltransferase
VSIATRTGDNGTSALMYGRRLPKHHVRVEAYGAVDELNAALGLARASGHQPFIGESLLLIQKDLVAIMGEMATALEDQERYAADGYPRLEPAMIERLDQLVARIEGEEVSFKGWATPGATLNSAALDVARTVCRRAERRISELNAVGELPNQRVLVYFNRLSDVLWLMARWVETHGDQASTS